MKYPTSGDPGGCVDPRNIAYTDLEAERPTVIFCAANMDYLSMVWRQRAAMTYYREPFENEYLRKRYWQKASEVFWSNRNQVQLGSDRLNLGCSFEYFAFLVNVVRDPSSCGDATVRADYAGWRSANGYLVDEEKFAGLRDAYPGVTDWQAALRFQNAMSQSFMGPVLQFAVLHEVGHVVLAHDPDAEDICGQDHLEVEADRFAERAMLKLKIATDTPELRKPQAIRAFFLVTLQPPGREATSAPAAAARRLRDGAMRSLGAFMFVPYRGSTKAEALVDRAILEILADTRLASAMNQPRASCPRGRRPANRP